MLTFLNILLTPSKIGESLLPSDEYRESWNSQSLVLYKSKKLGITYIFAFPWCSNQEVAKCKAALQNEPNLKVWFIFKFPFLSWNRQKFIENSGQMKCYFYQLQKGELIAFYRRKLPIEGGRNYTTHPFSLNFERPYETGLEGDFAFRMRNHKNFAKAINQKTAFLQQRPPLWKSLKDKTTYKTAASEAYEFLLKKLEC
jgi:hypothetical protein